jgi:hypothetical protein
MTPPIATLVRGRGLWPGPLDDDLRREGLARDIVRTVQLARQQASLEDTDRIERPGHAALLAHRNRHTGPDVVVARDDGAAAAGPRHFVSRPLV